MIKITKERKPKSIKLTKEEMQALRKFVYSQHTIVDAAAAIDIHRNVLDLVLIRETGSPETIEKIREKLSQLSAA